MRESSHTIARDNGLPVLRLHTTVVSRWLVTPIHFSIEHSKGAELGRTDDLDTATVVSDLLQLDYSLLDDLVAHLLYFGCIMFVPSDHEGE